VGDVFKKVQRGQPLQIPAETYNAFVDAVRSHRSSQHDLLRDVDNQFRQSTIIKVKNTSGSDLDRFAVLAFADPIVGPTDNLQQFKNQVNLQAVVPADPSKRFCVLMEPLANNAIGRAVVAGATPVKIDVKRESDTHAEIKPNETGHLRSSLSGPATILWKEPGTGVKWAVILLCGGDDSLVAFELIERVDYVDGFPVRATRILPDGSAGDEIKVQADPILLNIYGPADVGFRGWAKRIPTGETDEYGEPVYEHHIVHMQRFAQYIKFTAGFNGSCESAATVDDYWHGEDPGEWLVHARIQHLDCTCLGTETGIAVLDEKESEYPYLWYKVVDIDQQLQVAAIDQCDEGGYSCDGEPVSTLLFGKGLTLFDGDCSESCVKILQADGLAITQKPCDPEGEEIQTLGVRELFVEQPLQVVVPESYECEQTVTLKLTDDFIVAGECINIAVEGCRYTISVDRSCLVSDATIIGGNCIQVVDNGDGMVTINNTMTLSAGSGITIGGTTCNPIISAVEPGNTVLGGDCISVDDNGDGTVTINNDRTIIGGNGITVQESDCNTFISLSGATGDPKTTIRYVCGIACVQGSGGWYLQVKYGTLEIPAAIVASQTSECDDGGSGSGGGPPYTCADCPDCEEGEQKILKDDGSACDCIDDQAAMPEGWSQCVSGDWGFSYDVLKNCPPGSGESAYVPAYFHGMPPGADYYIGWARNVTKGTAIQYGPSTDVHEEVGWYWYYFPEGTEDGDELEIEVIYYSGDRSQGEQGTQVTSQATPFLCEEGVTG
jgi:hypothetical protein